MEGRDAGVAPDAVACTARAAGFAGQLIFNQWEIKQGDRHNPTNLAGAESNQARDIDDMVYLVADKLPGEPQAHASGVRRD